MNINLEVPDYTTICRRIQNITVKFSRKSVSGKINLILDSTGIKVVGEKESMNYKHGTRQRKIWRKLHIGVTDDCSPLVSGINFQRQFPRLS
jgi:hypothetical protein